MSGYGPAQCQAETCRALIRFVPTDESTMPLDWDPNPAGNIIMTDEMRDGFRIARVLTKDEPVPDGIPRWMPHFKTCPARDEFRNRPAPSWCPTGCNRKKNRRHYLCRECWAQLPAHTRRALYRRDGLASARLIELHREIRRDVPLSEIEVTP